ARASALALARHQNCIVAATGAVDLVTDGERVIEIANGSPLMSKVTALGCALSGIVAAFAAIEADKLMATVAALGVFGVAGEMAAEMAERPGSFRVEFLDALDEVGEEEILERLKAR
ncbi:MAG: hydroxyethylthiazole kinase, partial [Roseiarcus sp.]